ncbi:hypothetical protein ElyMa_002530800 [Elysia marginata]|uniref:mRNA cap 0 methyltransferase domain-containing protein n=1 Tax=Elysia marginata TaxID=1093978 RepID=A0AAV4GTU0_9GAST|nr:hypothetical protein ElyMa_002530800 [Elysia marginata]
MASKPNNQTLESLISQYRRFDASQGEAELEVRFRGVDSFIAGTVLRSLVAKKISVGDGTIAQTVNSIMDEDPSTLSPRLRGQSHGQTANLIRQISFADGKKTGERYYRKYPLAPPFRTRNSHGLDYNVVLSGEQALNGFFSSDASALIRVKCRASFVYIKSGEDSGSRWRIDLTVTRQLTGSDAQSGLSGVVTKMFRAGAMTPANMLDLLDLANPDSEHRSLYQYELEIEHLPGGDGKGRAAVRPSEVTTLVGEVLRLANPEYMKEAAYQAELFHVASFVVEAPGILRRFEHEWGLKRLVPQVQALTRIEYKSLYPPTGYFLLDKADGVRAIASVRDGGLRILADDLLEFHAPGYGPDSKVGKDCSPSEASRVANATILDGELVRKTDGGAFTFYAFDVIAVFGENVAAEGYEKRVSRLEVAVGALRAFGVGAEVKPIVHLTASEPSELKVQFLSPVFASRPYGTDGRILVEPGKPYRDTLTYKWKSRWATTIDCLARRPPASVLGTSFYADDPGHELYFLFVGINPDLFDALGLERVPGYRELFPSRLNSGSYFPIQFSPSGAPLAYLYQHPVEDPRKNTRGWEGWTRDIDRKVIEVRCAGSGEKCIGFGALSWQIVRVREDRTREIKTQQYFGNDFRIAELTMLNYSDPFEEYHLWDGLTLGYFAAPKAAIYAAQTAFTSFVKSRRIETDLSHAAWVVDAAIGKGQDFGRYLKAGVRHLVGIDLDQSALSELVRRKYSHAGGRHNKHASRRGPRKATTLFALWADLTSPHAEVSAKVRSIAGFPAAGADALVSNLAIHYFAGDIVFIRNFAALARSLVKDGGEVIITTMFGAKVHELLAAQGVAVGQSWDSRQEGVLKYSIRRDYAENSLTTAGQRIGVLLPFSNGEYYEEFLVNVDALVAEFTARGFSLVCASSFETYFGEYSLRHSTMYKLLTPEDFIFLSLYGEIVFRRKE